MTMPQNEFGIADLVKVTAVYSPSDGSPPETQQYGGVIVAVPPNYLPLPARGKLFGINGYSRQVEGAWQWVLQGDTNQVDSFVDSLAGGGHWKVPAARADMVVFCQQLLGLGIPSATIAARLPQIVGSIVAEVQAELTP